MIRTVRIAGIGGQGIVLAGYIIGNTACIFEGKFSTFTSSYGPAARGSVTYSSVIISSDPIGYPIIDEADIYIALSQKSFDDDPHRALTGRTIVFSDSRLVTSLPEGYRTGSVPATDIAAGLGTKLVANMVMLGFVTAQTGLLEKSAVMKSISSSVAQQYVSLNLQAFESGFDAGSSAGDEVSG